MIHNGTRELCCASYNFGCAKVLQISALSLHPHSAQPLMGFSHTWPRRGTLLVDRHHCAHRRLKTEESLIGSAFPMNKLTEVAYSVCTPITVRLCSI